MHELPIIKTIYKTVIKYAKDNNAEKVINVYLEIGVLRDFVPELLKKYWNYITEGDIAEGSNLLIREIPAVARCKKCKTEYQIDLNNIVNSNCPKCGCDTGELIKGRELYIYGIQINGKENNNE